MEYQSCLSDPTIPVVADASVAINLNATGYAEAILDALPCRVFIVDEVRCEIEAGRRNGRTDADVLRTHFEAGRMTIVELADTGLTHFANLVSGPTMETLDDGEAATIAYAYGQGAIALIDERKANRICTERFTQLVTGCTLDLFAHPDVRDHLGTDVFAEALYNSLYYGRMRVQASHTAWVVSIIGPERAKHCKSLPRHAR